MLSRAEAARIVALQRRKERAREGLFVAEGVRVVEELLAADIVLHSVVVSPSLEDSERGRALAVRAAARADVERVTDAELGRLAATETHQGVLAVAEIPLHHLEQRSPPADALVLVLDGVQDPGNLGTLVRTADAFAVYGVIALPGTVDCWNPKVVRAAAGSLFRTPVAYAPAAATADWLRAQAFRVYAADAGGAPIDDVSRSGRRALVVSNEGAGLSAEAHAMADARVAIAMPGRAESLNVAVAAGILLHALTHGNA